MATITICSVCYNSGGFESFDDIRRPLWQCDLCGKKCLGFVVNAKSDVSRAGVPAPDEPLREGSQRADHAPELFSTA